MLIEFALGEPYYLQDLVELKQHIQQWALRFDCRAYTEKTVKGVHRLCFFDDDLYFLFMLSWNQWDQYPPKLVQERNRE